MELTACLQKLMEMMPT